MPQIPPNYQLYGKISGHTGAISFCGFSPSGELLAIASADGTVSVWDTKFVSIIQRLVGHGGGVSWLSWTGNSDYIASASDDKTIRIWSVKTGKCLKILKGHRGPVFCVAFCPHGSIVASGSVDESVKLWDLRSGVNIRTISAHSDVVTSIAFNKDGTILASTGFDGLCRMWETQSGRCICTITESANVPITYCTFTPNSKFILVSYLNGSHVLYDVATRKQAKSYTGHKNEKYCVSACFSVTHGMWVVSGSESGRLMLWDLQTREVVQTLQVGSDSDVLLAVACNPGCSMIACGGSSSGNTVSIYVDRNDPLFFETGSQQEDSRMSAMTM